MSVIRNTLNLAWSLLAILTSPLWWFPINILIKIMEPHEKKRREKAIREHMDRMFPNKRA